MSGYFRIQVQSQSTEAGIIQHNVNARKMFIIRCAYCSNLELEFILSFESIFGETQT
jgi:hypothetical protein